MPSINIQPGKPHSDTRAFSLVELLVVIAVIGLLAGLSLPAFTMLEGRSVGIGAARFAETIQLARSEAISRRAPVRLRLAKDWPGRSDRNMRTFSVWTLAPDGDYGVPADWSQIGRWQELPVGVVTVRAEVAAVDSLWAAMREEGTIDASGASVDVVSLEFGPTGALTPGGGGSGLGSALQLRFSTGYYTDQGEFVQTGKDTDWLALTIESLTGFSRVHTPESL